MSATMTEERAEQVFDTGPQAEVSVENVRGPVTIDAWDETRVHVVAVRRGAGVQVVMDHDGARVSVRTEADQGEGSFFGWFGKEQRGEVEYTLRVPRETQLTARTVTGAVRISGVQGTVDASSVHGSASVADGGGAVRIQATNGHIEVTNTRGQVETYTANGAIAIRGGQVERLTAESVNGMISVEPLTIGAMVKARTVNGELALALPPGVAAEVEASGVMLRTHFEVTYQSANESRGVWRGLIGQGAPSAQVTFSTVNGALIVRGAGVAATAPVATAATPPVSATPPAPPPPATPPSPVTPPPPPPSAAPARSTMEILAAVERGEISVDEAVALMRQASS